MENFAHLQNIYFNTSPETLRVWGVLKNGKVAQTLKPFITWVGVYGRYATYEVDAKHEQTLQNLGLRKVG